MSGILDREMHIKGLSINWDKIPQGSYLRDIPAISKITNMVFDTPITFFVGENGSGKSTLLEAMAVSYGFNPEGETKASGSYRQEKNSNYDGSGYVIFVQ